MALVVDIKEVGSEPTPERIGWVSVPIALPKYYPVQWLSLLLCYLRAVFPYHASELVVVAATLGGAVHLERCARGTMLVCVYLWLTRFAAS
jgi:hypothetical protein